MVLLGGVAIGRGVGRGDPGWVRVEVLSDAFPVQLASGFNFSAMNIERGS